MSAESNEPISSDATNLHHRDYSEKLVYEAFNVTDINNTNISDKQIREASDELDVGFGPVLDPKSEGSTRRGLKSRHAQMIALGGTIGTGLFVGSGQALHAGGPAFLFLAYCLIAIFVYGIVTATTEISAYMPVHGSTMASYASRYVSPSLGFAIVVPYEITAAGLVIDYWPNDINIAVIWRGTLAIGVIVSSNAPGLIGGGAGAASSPWVIAIKDAGISGLDSVINAVIITSAWSSGNSYLYMSSRSLYSLALSGNAPKVFKKCNRWGVPYPALIASSMFSLLAYLNCASNGVQVFNWFINLTNTSGFISWICCCVVYFRFRKACVAHEITDLPYRSRFQPYLAYMSICAFTVLLLCNGFGVFFPSRWSVSSFLTAYIGLPIFLSIYFCHRTFHRSDEWMLNPANVDMASGLEEVLVTEADVPGRTGPWYHNLGKIWQ